jgi:threonine/homoserine/homoserine lactone efflux protein
MGLEVLLRGLIVGLIASITLGPVGVMSIQRTLSKNRQSGFVSGLGAATADTIFAILAYFFIAIISSVIENHLQILKILGGICVVIVGVNIFLTNPVVQIRRNRAGKSNLWQDYASTFGLTLTNPAFILWLLVIFSAFNVGSAEGEITFSSLKTGALMIGGFFGGAATWWFLLSFTISLFRKKFRPRHLLWINRIAGILIAGLGAVAIISAFI